VSTFFATSASGQHAFAPFPTANQTAPASQAPIPPRRLVTESDWEHDMSSSDAAEAAATATASLANSLLNHAATPEALVKLLTRPLDEQAVHARGLFGWMLYLIASVILAASRLSLWILSFATITVPTLIFKVLSVSFTLTLNFSSLYATTAIFTDLGCF
jgi:hypothetical protein